MNIFYRDIIDEISNHVDYKNLHLLLQINLLFNKIVKNKIKLYPFDAILKELHIGTKLITYTTTLPRKTNVKNCISYDSGRTIISCSKISIDEITNKIKKELNITEVNVKVLTMTLQFNNPIFKEKYDDITDMNDRKSFLNTKVLIYDNYKFNIFRDGYCRVLCKNPKNFLSAYKQLMNNI